MQPAPQLPHVHNEPHSKLACMQACDASMCRQIQPDAVMQAGDIMRWFKFNKRMRNRQRACM